MYDFSDTQEFIYTQSDYQFISSEISENHITAILLNESPQSKEYMKLEYTIKDQFIFEYRETTYSNEQLTDIITIFVYTHDIPEYNTIVERSNKLINDGTLEDSLEYNYFQDLMK